MTPFDQEMMQRCLQLAQKARGQTAPNPLVGAVVVKDQKIIGEGFHPGAGQPHAEVFALREAGAQAQGATIYVNLEPCNHHGRTPPCSQAVVKAGIKKAVVGMVDPNPKVAGGGIATLEAAGIEVLVGVEEAACQRLNEAFCYRILHHRPFGILKYAMTLDGKIAADSGHSRWITGTQARQYVHQLRGDVDAVVIGGNTLRQDNPDLTTHDTIAPNPLRVVMSRHLNVPEVAKLWDTTAAPTLVLTTAPSDRHRVAALEKQGVEVVILPDLSPQSAMDLFYGRGFLSVLWECGGTLAAQAITQGVVQKVEAFIAPKIIGGEGAPSPVGNLGLKQMDQAIAVDRSRFQQFGPDLLWQGYLSGTTENR